ncbi:Kelch-like protein 21 like protein [Argiope bruennichi]|uniref:Kelch-like protein 21 like protein n=1 Tax=Argiope bruennichi TaxID=94029 RepID=A0A8T0EPL5_ARGBR|nr:Kelch-like protein 21 like protein [Argiope bruennichi]
MERPIKHVSSWIGQIKTDILRFHVPHPEAQNVKPDVEKDIGKAFFLQYDFTFENGLALDSEIDEEVEESVESLEDVYRSMSYVDIIVNTPTKNFPAHKAILCARAPGFKSTIKTDSSNIVFHYLNEDNIEQLLNFFYTDQVELLSVEDTLPLFHLAATLNVKPLETKCILFLKDHLDLLNIIAILGQACLFQHRTLMSVVEDFILNNYALILGSHHFRSVTERFLELRKYILLLKYKKDKTRHVQRLSNS